MKIEILIKEEKKVKLKLIDLRTGRIFYKYFETEFERDKFKRKLRFSKNIKTVYEVTNDWGD